MLMTASIIGSSNDYLGGWVLVKGCDLDYTASDSA
jgi:hypothetical protein